MENVAVRDRYVTGMPSASTFSLGVFSVTFHQTSSLFKQSTDLRRDTLPHKKGSRFVVHALACRPGFRHAKAYTTNLSPLQVIRNEN